MVTNSNKLVILGYGLVGQSLHRLLKQDSYFDKYEIFVLEKNNNLNIFIENGGNKDYFFNEEINLSNYKNIYSKYLRSGDTLIDLSTQTKNIDSLNWCMQNNIHYLSTSDSSWMEDASFKSIYQHFQEYINLKKDYVLGYPTCLIQFGMNPGLVSTFVKQCLINIINNSKWNFLLNKKLLHFLKKNRFNKIAKILGLETVIVVDNDNSLADIKYENNVLYNTWNCHSLYCEFFSNTEIAIGTNFNILHLSNHIIDYVDKDGFCLLKHRGYNMKLKTWSPLGYFDGSLIPHDEIYSIGRWLSLWNKTHTTYKPTVIFSYKPCDLALQSLNVIKNNHYVEPPRLININNHLISGGEFVGVILIGKKFKTRCFGNYIDVETLQKNKIHETPTILQVSASCMSGLKYILNNPNKGLLFPEDLPTNEIFENVSKYLGSFMDKEIEYKFSFDDICFISN